MATTPDTTKTSYTYILNNNGTVTYTADADGKQQNLSGRDTTSKEALEADLKQYTTAYVTGLKTEQPTVPSDLTVGKAVTADAGSVGA